MPSGVSDQAIGTNSGGLVARLRNPPGGRDAKIMLFALFLDRTGSGVWGACSVLYFTFVAGLPARQLGLLLGVAGIAGIAGSPLAGRLAGRLPVRVVLIGCHLLRLVTLSLLLVCTGFGALLPVVAATYLGDRAAKTMEMLFATRVAGAHRATYQALSRSSANAGYALGAGIAAIGLAVGTRAAYDALILCDAFSFLVAAMLVSRTREPLVQERVRGPKATPDAAATPSRPSAPNPWRDRRYLLFVLLDMPLSLDDSILNVGLPLWLVNHTKAPHAIVPAFMVINTVLVVALQIRVSSRVNGPRQATSALLLYAPAMLACCTILALATGGDAVTASIAMLLATAAVTMAELMRSVTSWELAVSLAPPDARAAYLGVAGMSQSVQKSIGPVLLTGVVMVAGPAGWLVLGTTVGGLATVQRRACLHRLGTMHAMAGPTPTAEPVTAA